MKNDIYEPLPGQENLRHLLDIYHRDRKELFEKGSVYGPSWKQRGGVGAFMMLARKWDRLENILRRHEKEYNIFDAIEKTITQQEGVLEQIRDLRNYLALVESEMVERGIVCLPGIAPGQVHPSFASRKERRDTLKVSEDK